MRSGPRDRRGGVVCRPRARFRLVQQRNRGVNDPMWRARNSSAPRSGVVHATVPGVAGPLQDAHKCGRSTPPATGMCRPLTRSAAVFVTAQASRRPRPSSRTRSQSSAHRRSVTVLTARRLTGHHACESGAVLGAVNASSLRSDRYAASGIDRASAQLTTWHLRDGRGGDCFVRPDA